MHTNPLLQKYKRWAGIMLATILLHSSFSMAESLPPVWLSSVCFKIPLHVWDKLGVRGSFIVKYIITEDGGRVYVAEKRGFADNVESASVNFPDDFVEIKTGLPAYASCASGAHYKWKIYVDKKLVDNGFFDFGRYGRNPRPMAQTIN